MDAQMTELLTRLGRLEGATDYIKQSVDRIEEEVGGHTTRIAGVESEVRWVKRLGAPLTVVGGFLGALLRQAWGAWIPDL